MAQPMFTQGDVTKIFHITRLFLAGYTANGVTEQLDMTQEELDALQAKIEQWEDEQC